MLMFYHHTQRGTLMLIVLLIAAVMFALIGFQNLSSAGPGRWFAFAGAVGFAVLTWIFSSLTADVDAQELRWHFGPGIWTYRVPLDDIESVRVVRNSWWNGFGIRMRPGFRLYNVSGLDAVRASTQGRRHLPDRYRRPAGPGARSQHLTAVRCIAVSVESAANYKRRLPPRSTQFTLGVFAMPEGQAQNLLSVGCSVLVAKSALETIGERGLPRVRE